MRALLQILVCLFSFVSYQTICIAATADTDPAVLSLDSAILHLLRHSQKRQWSKQQLIINEERLRAARAGLRTFADLDLKVPTYETQVEGIKDYETGITEYAYTKNIKYVSTLSLNQPLPTDGRFSLNHEFLYHLQKNNRKNYVNSIFLELNQPLFQPNRIKNSIMRAEYNLEWWRMEYIDDAFDFMEYVIQMYFDLYETESTLQLTHEQVRQLKRSLDRTRRNIDAGEGEIREALQIEASYLETQARVAELTFELGRKKERLKEYIGLAPETDFSLLTDFTFTPIQIDESRAVSYALNNNPDLRRTYLRIKQEEISLQEIKSWSRPRAYLQATLGLDKKDPVIRYAWRKFDRTNSVMFRIDFPLWDWGRRKAYYRRQQAYIRSIETYSLENRLWTIRNVKNASRRLRVSIDRLALLTRTVRQAERSYTFSLEQFDAGQTSGRELLLVLQQLMDARNSYAKAYVNYRISLARLARMTLWDFEKDEPIQLPIFD